MRELAIRASSTHLPQRVKKLILPYVGPETTVEDDPLNKPEQISWVLASQEPEQLALFYAELFHCKASAGFSSRHWLVPLGAGFSLEIYQPSSRRIFPPTRPGPGPLSAFDTGIGSSGGAHVMG